jgi:precorrin-4 methylase
MGSNHEYLNLSDARLVANCHLVAYLGGVLPLELAQQARKAEIARNGEKQTRNKPPKPGGGKKARIGDVALGHNF